LKNSKDVYESERIFEEIDGLDGYIDKWQDTLDNKEIGGAKKTLL
jgi:hypothetical protein